MSAKIFVMTVIAGIVTAWIVAKMMEPKTARELYKTADGGPPKQLDGIDPTTMFTVVPNARQGTVGGKAEFQ